MAKDRTKYNKEYYRRNRERLLAKQKKYYRENSEKIIEWNRKYRDENPEAVKERSRRWRRKNVDKLKEYRKEHKAENAAYAREYRRKTKNKYNEAHHAVSNAIKLGKIEKQPCEKCGDWDAQAHHDDYNKPLDVRWLCKKCHLLWHKEHTPVYRKEKNG